MHEAQGAQVPTTTGNQEMIHLVKTTLKHSYIINILARIIYFAF